MTDHRRDKHTRNKPAEKGSTAAKVQHAKAVVAAQNAASKKKKSEPASKLERVTLADGTKVEQHADAPKDLFAGTVVSMKWLGPSKHQFKLKDGTTIETMRLVGIGFDSKRKASHSFVIGDKRYVNAVPDAEIAAWDKLNSKHHDSQRKEQQKILRETAIPAPIVEQRKERSNPGRHDAHSQVQESSDMKVKHADLVKLLEGLDVRTAAKWPNDRLLRKIEALPKMVEGSADDVAKLDEGSQKLLKRLLKAVESEDEIEITGAASDSDDASDEKGKTSKKKAAKEEDDSEDESEDEDDDAESDEEEGDDDSEDEDEKPAKKAKGKKASEKPAKGKKAAAAEDDEEDDSGDDKDDDEKPAKKGKKKAAAESDDDDSVPVRKPRKKGDSDKQPSNKERIWRLWKDNKKADPVKLKKQAKADVEDQTVKNWCRRWAKGKGLPAAARK